MYDYINRVVIMLPLTVYEGTCVGERCRKQKISYAHARSIMVMHSNEREECCPRTLVDRKWKHYDNAVDVVVHLHDPTDPSTESMAPPRSAHVQLGDIPRTLDPAECRGRALSARRRDDGDDEVTDAGLRLSTTTI